MSTYNEISIDVKTDEETSGFIQQALVNCRIPFKMISKDPLKIRLPCTVDVLTMVVTILDKKKSLIEGQVSLPDGRSYKVEEKGMEELKGDLVQLLEQPQPAQQVAAPTTHWLADILRELLKDTGATSKLVREISAAIRGDPQALMAETKQVTNVTLAILIILCGVIVATSILAGLGRMSGDATGFIFGTVLGSAFTFLQRYLTKPEE
jgi:hypothetical protein